MWPFDYFRKRREKKLQKMLSKSGLPLPKLKDEDCDCSVIWVNDNNGVCIKCGGSWRRVFGLYIDGKPHYVPNRGDKSLQSEHRELVDENLSVRKTWGGV